jgi:hypothetical protein
MSLPFLLHSSSAQKHDLNLLIHPTYSLTKFTKFLQLPQYQKGSQKVADAFWLQNPLSS